MPRGVLLGTVDLWDCTVRHGRFEWHLRAPERSGEVLVPANSPRPIWFTPF